MPIQHKLAFLAFLIYIVKKETGMTGKRGRIRYIDYSAINIIHSTIYQVTELTIYRVNTKYHDILLNY